MINYLTINNFESWKNATFDFVPGVNVIVGPTDAGKSALIRSLEWVLFNRPGGTEYKSSWGGVTDVTVCFDSKVSITRERGVASVNRYAIHDLINDKRKPLTGFGQRIPDEVSSIHNMGDLNLQKQTDPLFLLQNPPYSPGEVARHFNKVAGLSQIDSLLKELRSHYSICKQEVDKTESFLKQKKEERKNYNGLEDAEPVFLQANVIEQEIKIRNHSIRSLLTNCNEIKVVNTQIENATIIPVKTKEFIDKALSAYAMQDEQETKIADIKAILSRIQNTEQVIQRTQDGLTALRTEFEKQMPDVCPLCDTILNGY